VQAALIVLSRFGDRLRAPFLYTVVWMLAEADAVADAAGAAGV